MKKITLFLILISGIVLLDACTKVETDPVLNMSTAIAPVMNAPADGSSFILTQDNAGDTIIFEWSAASYNLTDLAATSYLLQMTPVASNFDEAKDVISTNETSFTTTVGAFNTALISMGLTAGEATEVQFRVTASLRSHDDGGVIPTSAMNSEVIKSTFTTYASEVVYPKLWVPGAYQGWSPDVAPVLQSFEDNNIFTGYIYFPEDSESFFFKFTSEPSWDGTNYGAGEGPGTLSTTGGDLELPGPGGYRLTANINDLTWTFELQTWGIIGQFNDWSEQINMEWDAENNYLTLTTDIPAAEENRFLFRANDDWDMKLGDIDPPDGVTLSSSGSDIPLTDGNRTFHLILSGPEAKYELIEN